MVLKDRDKKEICVSFLQGHDQSNKAFYSAPIKTKCQICKNNGELLRSENGLSKDSELLLYFDNKEEINKHISETTRFYIFNRPNGNNFDFQVLKKGFWSNGVLPIKVVSVALNYYTMWVSLDNYNVLSIQGFFDEKKKELRIAKDYYLPFSKDVKLWLEEPQSISDTNALYRFVDKKVVADEIIYVLDKVGK